MKRAQDPRHLKRIKAVQSIFSDLFCENSKKKKSPYLVKIGPFFSKIDSLIEKAAPQFPVSKIARIDVAILRLSIYELLFEKKQPPKVIIDEAVELAKQFGGEGSPAFVNGVLGTLLKKNEK